MGDIRPTLIRLVKEVHEFEPQRSLTSRQFQSVATKARSLRNVLPRMEGHPPHAGPVLDELIAHCDQKAAAKQEKKVTSTRRNLVTAHRTYDLLLDGGFGVPSLAPDGQ